jgi:hypothetical protein
MKKKYTLEELKELHRLIEVFYMKPTSWDGMEDIPVDLLNSWKDFITAREKLWEQMELNGVKAT